MILLDIDNGLAERSTSFKSLGWELITLMGSECSTFRRDCYSENQNNPCSELKKYGKMQIIHHRKYELRRFMDLGLARFLGFSRILDRKKEKKQEPASCDLSLERTLGRMIQILCI